MGINLLILLACRIIDALLKAFISWLICKHPILSDEKVKCITRMIAKDKKPYDHHNLSHAFNEFLKIELVKCSM